MLLLMGTAMLVVVRLAGAGGAKMIGDSGVPLVDALRASGGHGIATRVNVPALVGTVASFLSVIFGYRQLVLVLSRAGYLPRFLSLTGERKTPVWVLSAPGLPGFIVSLGRGR